MRNVRLTGQFFMFALGSWIGSIIAGFAEGWLRSRPPTNGELPREILIALYIPLCLVFATLFFAWIAFRSRRTVAKQAVRWYVPFLLGITYFPVLFGLIQMLLVLTRQGQGMLIGTSIFTVMFGLLVGLAEAAFQFGMKHG